jgi:hypothetical protein
VTCTSVALTGLTSAQVEARYMLLIVPKRMMKRQPKARLISAHTRDMRAAVRVIGSYAISGTWNMVTIALQRNASVCYLDLSNGEMTNEQMRAETRLSAFHSLSSESINSSQEFLNLARAGDTAGGVQSSGNGSTGGAVLFVARRFEVDSLLGRLDSIIRCISFLLTSAS